MPTTLIVYGTRKGASADTADEIGRVLREVFKHDITEWAEEIGKKF